MTVCIAAISSSLKRIITVSDKALSTESASSPDAVVKARSLTSDQRWHCLVSGLRATHVSTVYNRVVESLKTLTPPVSAAVLSAAIERAYADELQHMTEHILGRYGMNLSEFKDHGRQKLGGKSFDDIMRAIAALDTYVQLLVFGFDESGDAHILKVSTAGAVTSSDFVAFDAIGSGALIAIDFLLATGAAHKSADIGEIIYWLCDAKFTAEGAEGVGVPTVVYSITEDGVAFHFRAADSARKLWDERRAAKIPDDVLTDIRRELSFDSEGREHLDLAAERLTDLMNNFDRIMRDLDVLHARGVVVDRRWLRVMNVKSGFDQYVPLITASLQRWTDLQVKPDGFDVLYGQVARFVSKLEQIAARPAGDDATPQ